MFTENTSFEKITVLASILLATINKERVKNVLHFTKKYIQLEKFEFSCSKRNSPFLDCKKHLN